MKIEEDVGILEGVGHVWREEDLEEKEQHLEIDLFQH